MSRRIREADLEPLMRALRKFRAANHLTQQEMADELGISRKTYVLFETCRWFPPFKERAHTLKRLHELDRALADTFLQVTGEDLSDYAIDAGSNGTAQQSGISATAARAAYEKAVSIVAAERDLTRSAVKRVATSVIAALAAAGLTMQQAQEVTAAEDPNAKQ